MAQLEVLLVRVNLKN